MSYLQTEEKLSNYRPVSLSEHLKEQEKDSSHFLQRHARQVTLIAAFGFHPQFFTASLSEDIFLEMFM